MSARLLMVRELRRSSADDPGEREVVESIPRGMDTFPIAAQLWRLVDPGRANQIEAVYARVNRRAGLTGDDIRYEVDDLRELDELFGGLRAALLAAGIVNDKLVIQPAQVADLGARVPAIYMGRRSPSDAVWALAEGIINVEGLRAFLAEAIARGCDVVASF